MDARNGCAVRRVWLAFGMVSVLVAGMASSLGAASYETTNFSVTAATGQLAKEIGDAAETYRRELAIEWLGKELPAWSKRCPIRVQVSPKLGAGGATSFLFHHGEVYGWDMEIQGSRERILDSVLPHEITHMIFASHFRCPLPRWADEGASTSVEHPSEITKHKQMLVKFLRTRRAIPFSRMMTMTEYPRDIMPLYAQGHAVVDFLIQRKGKRAFLSFLSDGIQSQKWSTTVQHHYGYQNLLALQNDWLDWIKQGRPAIEWEPDEGPAATALAAAPASDRASNTLAVAARPKWPTPNLIYRNDHASCAASPVPPNRSAPDPVALRAGNSGEGQGGIPGQQVVFEWNRTETGSAGGGPATAPNDLLDASLATGSIRR